MFKKIAENLTNKEWHSIMTNDISVDVLAAKVKNRQIPVWYKPVIEHSAFNDSMLELGSGTGQLSAMLRLNNRITYLLDYSQESINFSKALFEMLKLEGFFYSSDALKKLPLENSSIDWVWSSGLLEHFSDDQILEILKESARVCRKGVMSLVPNANSIFYRIGKFKMEQEGRWPYGREIPKLTMKELFVAAGLSNIKEFSVGSYDALQFWGSSNKDIKDFFDSLCLEELRSLNQGYLLFTYGEKPNA